MEHFGEVFRNLRESRHISLEEATGGHFSSSMLSKFETGKKSELSATKLIMALENIHVTFDEFLYLARGFREDERSELGKEITAVLDVKDITYLKKLYNREIRRSQYASNKTHVILNAVMIKAYMNALDNTIQMSAEEENVLYEYLFSTEIWGYYELKLFTSVANLLSTKLLVKYAREMIRKMDFFNKIKENRLLFHTMLLNGLMTCLDRNDFLNARYFQAQIDSNFYEENESYYRILYLWTKGVFDYKKSKGKAGYEQMKQAIDILALCQL